MITKQVKFVDAHEHTIHGGILITEGWEQYVICGCCGSVFEIEDIEIVKEYPDWIDISDSIIGE